MRKGLLMCIAFCPWIRHFYDRQLMMFSKVNPSTSESTDLLSRKQNSIITKNIFLNCF